MTNPYGRLHESFVELATWGERREWRGTDPYDGLNATRFAEPLRRTAIGRRLITQVVKRSPLNLRPLLGIRPQATAVAEALVVSAYSRQRVFDDETSRTRLDRALERLLEFRCADYQELAWGYHFDVQTRVFFYPKGAPNTIATACGGFALLDAYERLGDERLLDLAQDVAAFFLRWVPQTEADGTAFFGYLVGDRTAIHNANMLVAALLARVGTASGRSELIERAALAAAFTVGRQRPDGSWPYGETSNLGWVDGFHTGYVLECLLACADARIEGCELAASRGLDFYRHALFLSDGTAKYFPNAVYPLDIQCAAQGIQTFALAGRLDASYQSFAWTILERSLRTFRRRDGAFRFQRRRLWTNATPHIRWAEAPMFAAMATLTGVEHR